MKALRASIVTRCDQCGQWYRDARDGQKWCSPACRQAAYRRRLDPETGYTARRRAGARKAYSTKHGQAKSEYCPACGQMFYCSGLEPLRIYCSNACKQRAYRQRVTMRASNEGKR